MKRYTRNRRDNVENALVRHARALGAQFLEAPPLDGWALHRGVWTPCEIKDPSREGKAGEYTSAQLRFFRWCREHRAKWWTWRTIDDVEKDLGARRVA